jgi:hypothetical protein
VEGGEDGEIAQEIALRKTPGCYTYGTTQVLLEMGVMRFFRPDYVDISVIITLRPLSGYTSQTEEDIKAAASEYINSLSIGYGLAVSALWGAAMSANKDLKRPGFSITGIVAGRAGHESARDVELAFNETTRCTLEDVIIQEGL